MLIGITLLEEWIPGRKEQRDALDRRWPIFLEECGLSPVLLPNQQTVVARLLARLPIAGVLLSGGGEPTHKTQRAAVEQLVLDWSKSHAKPVLGVCRGMQAILAFEGFSASKVAGHVATRHRLSSSPKREVNSFHEYGYLGDLAPYVVRARAPDGTAEWVEHDTRRWAGIMWHPEREEAPQDADIALVRGWFRNHD